MAPSVGRHLRSRSMHDDPETSAQGERDTANNLPLRGGSDLSPPPPRARDLPREVPLGPQQDPPPLAPPREVPLGHQHDLPLHTPPRTVQINEDLQRMITKASTCAATEAVAQYIATAEANASLVVPPWDSLRITTSLPLAGSGSTPPQLSSSPGSPSRPRS